MYEISAQVLSVVGGPAGSSGKTKYEVAMSDGQKYVTFNGPLAAKADSLKGQVVAARVDVKQNGQYTNYYLNDIGLPGTLAALANPTQVASVPAQTLAAIPFVKDERVPDKERQKLIVRQNVLGTAFDFVAALYNGAGPEALEEARDQALDLAKTLYGRVFAQDAVAPEPVAVTVPDTVGADQHAPEAIVPEW